MNEGLVFEKEIEASGGASFCFEVGFRLMIDQVNYVVQFPRFSGVSIGVALAGGGLVEVKPDEQGFSAFSAPLKSDGSLFVVRTRKATDGKAVRLLISINAGQLDGVGVVHISAEEKDKN